MGLYGVDSDLARFWIIIQKKINGYLSTSPFHHWLYHSCFRLLMGFGALRFTLDVYCKAVWHVQIPLVIGFFFIAHLAHRADELLQPGLYEYVRAWSVRSVINAIYGEEGRSERRNCERD